MLKNHVGGAVNSVQELKEAKKAAAEVLKQRQKLNGEIATVQAIGKVRSMLGVFNSGRAALPQNNSQNPAPAQSLAPGKKF